MVLFKVYYANESDFHSYDDENWKFFILIRLFKKPVMDRSFLKGSMKNILK